jgi:regulator of nucleoside diphosphate kinase
MARTRRMRYTPSVNEYQGNYRRHTCAHTGKSNLVESTRILITDQDMRRIRRVLNSSSASLLGDSLAELARSLKCAVQVRSDCIRADVVTLDSRVSIEDPETGCLNEYTLVLPGEFGVDHSVDGLSVLAPLGWEILSRREGDWVQFRTPGNGSRRAKIRRIHFQPEAERAQACARGADHPHRERQEHPMHPEYPLERLCSLLYEPFQLTFAQHAEQVLREEDQVQVEATHRGLVLRGETEAAFEHSVRMLRNYYGNQIDVGPAAVRYHNGTTVEEPLMGLRVNCSREHFEAVRADLSLRNAVVVASDIGPARAVIRAVVPLEKLLGYATRLAQLTSGTAHEVMWLSHYASMNTPSPDDTAA